MSYFFVAERQLDNPIWPAPGRWLLARGLLTLLLVASASVAIAQGSAGGYLHTHYTVDDGLPTDMLTTALGTPDGYLWFGTQDGLVRYDGHRFVVFNTGNVETFTDNRITNLALAPQGDLWILTEGSSLLRYDAGRFTRFDQHLDLGGAPIYWIVPTPEGNLFVGRQGLFRYRDGGFEAREGGWDDFVQAVRMDRHGRLWLGFRSSGAVRIQGGSLQFFTHCEDRPIDNVLGFFERPDGSMWVQTELELCSIENGQPGKILQTEGLTDRQMFELRYSWHHQNPSIARLGERVGYDRQGQIRRIDPDRWLPKDVPLVWDSYHVYTLDSGRNPTRIGYIMAVTRDHEGGFWFATNSEGLHHFRPVPIRTYGGEDGLLDEIYYAVAEGSDGSIFAGGVTTISRFDGRRFEPLLEHRSWWAYLRRDQAGELWFAGIKDLPHRFQDGSFEPLSASPLVQGSTAVWQAKDGVHWFGTLTGLHALRDGDWSSYALEDGLPFEPNDLFETRDGALWLKSIDHGLARFHEGRFVLFNTEHGLPGNDVRYIYEDDDGILWLAIYGFGLVRVDSSSIAIWDDGAFHRARLTRYSQRNGLFDDAVSSIVEDDHGRLWLSSNRGIFWVPKADLEAVADGRAERFYTASYGVKDGMRNREANGATQAAALKASDGRLWYPTMDGVVVLDPSQVDREPPPTVLFEELRSRQEVLLPADGNIDLGAAQRTFEVAVTVPVFAAPEQVRLRYRLAGYDDTWHETTRRRLAYTQVPGGTYTLQVQASNRSGLWSETIAGLRVHIEPFFYETWWFRSLAVLTVLFLAAGVLQLRVRRLLERERKLETLVRQRTADLATEKEKVAAQAEQLATLDRAKSHFFANISHEFRTPLTLLIGPLEDSLAGRHGTLSRSMQETMLRNSRRLLRLVEQLLDLARFEAGELKLEPTVNDLGTLVQQTASSFTPLAERLGIQLSWETIDLPALYFDREKLEKVLLNLISNACKFTPAGGRVEVVMAADDQQVEMAVRDTGSGISEEDLPRIFERFYHTDERRTDGQASTGLGLSLSQELTRLHGGMLRVESTLGQGSTFTICLPRTAVAVPEDTKGSARKTALREPAEPATESRSPAFGRPPHRATDGPDGEPSDSPDFDGGEGERRIILVIDDNADVRRYVSSVLCGEYRIVEAEDGEEGLQAARIHSPDLIISDVMMPRLDGYALARSLKEDPMTAGIPIILLTAKAATKDRVTGLATGVDSYLTKPFEGAVLEARVQNLIALRLRLKELYRQGKVAETEAPAAHSDSAFEEQARAAITSRLTDDDFSVESLAADLFLSRSQLFRRLREEAGTTPTRLIRTVRLEKAAQLLRTPAGNVTEVAYAVGFKSLSHFTRCFRNHFQSLPSDFLRSSVAQTRQPQESGGSPDSSRSSVESGYS